MAVGNTLRYILLLITTLVIIVPTSQVEAFQSARELVGKWNVALKSGRRIDNLPMVIEMGSNDMLNARFTSKPDFEVIEVKVTGTKLTLRIRENDDCSKRVLMMSLKWKKDRLRGSISGPNSRCKSDAFYGQTGSFFDSVTVVPAPDHQLSKN
jgi:hypothetical protein